MIRTESGERCLLNRVYNLQTQPVHCCVRCIYFDQSCEQCNYICVLVLFHVGIEITQALAVKKDNRF